MIWNLSHRLSPLVAAPLLALALCLSLPSRSAAALLVPGTTISLQALINSLYVNADNNGTSPLIANASSIGSGETFTVVDAGNGNIALKSQINGMYVCADNAGASPLIANRTAIGSYETFTEVDLGGSNIGLLAQVNGKYVCADNAGASPLIANRTTIGSWETFTVHSAQAPAPAITNSSFETPSMGSAHFQYTPAGASWSFASTAGIQSNGSGWSTTNAPNGTQTAFLQGYPNGLGSMSQNVTFTGAGSYALTFQAAQRSGQVQPLQFTIDGSQVGGFLTPTSNSFGLLTSAPFTISAAGVHTLKLAATSTSADLSTLVDQVSLIAAAAPNLPKVYIGSLNGWGTLAANPNQWSYVRANADGMYANFIQLLPTVGNPQSLCNQIAAMMTHKNAYFESDSRYTGLGGFPNGGQYTLDTEAQEMNELLSAGFTITYSSLNYGVDSAKEAQCRTLGLPSGTTRPCLAQNGPWTFNGDVHNSSSSIADINNSDGASTDGPLDLWLSNNGGMQQGSVSDVTYAHSIHKLAMVMVSPGQLPASQWLATVQQCVRYQEAQGGKPDIWADYAYDTYTPTVPETNSDGTPANTITGAAFWLIHHVTDPAHYARLTLPETVPGLHLQSTPTTLSASVREAKGFTGTTPTESTEADLTIPVTRLANGRTMATQVVNLTLHNESKWLDLSPVLCASIDDPGHRWTVSFRLGGKEITPSVVEKGGFMFVKDQRLLPQDTRQLQMVLTCQDPSGATADANAVSVRLSLLANPTRRDKLTQTVTIHGSTSDRTAMVASAANIARL